MRIFLALLIFAIGFSGFSAAGHAFGKDSCAPASQSETLKKDISDCQHQKNTDSEKTEKAPCLDCMHCCAGHVANLSDISVKLSPVETVLAALPLQTLKSNWLFSLLRPPKTIA